MKSIWPGGVIALALCGTTVAAIDVEIGPSAIEAALSLARDSEAARAAFHRRYTFAANDATVERIEVITETRRLVQTAEARLAGGDRLFGSGARAAQEALRQWRGRVAVLARLRFHPQNTYVTVPSIAITLHTPAGDVRPLETHSEPVLSLPSGTRGERLPVLGASAEALFDAAAVGQMSRTVVVQLDDKELVRLPVDFGRLK